MQAENQDRRSSLEIPNIFVACIEADDITPAIALDVDQQIRRRANATKHNGAINQHLYLIGWVGGWFRPYY
jgi:hypothetical protein